MPIHEYIHRGEDFKHCDHTEEVFTKSMKIKPPEEIECPRCRQMLFKSMATGGFILKGTGWEKDGYAGGKN